ncbi:DUF3037 domain-containing protein [Flavobacterium supellecticarium]|uniref:DUF3037 domain-containing protein n=1 Tax=Flavobacterium supellecticarium TaxID=2565924 RepID=A0A4S3ZQN6_9FLAO|nr:DUF3037 domain-containing protein [Flavobacterium supellecticarium]THF47887.1 DUF3037 domain-containing protein [Flavobacterium supellecticarium]
MQDKHLYEYAVIRVLPKVEREEFLNVGIILFSKSAQYINVRFSINEQKLLMLSDELDIEQLQQNLESFQKIALGDKNGGPIAQLDIPSRFRWLTAVRSSVIQTSRPHPGFCANLDRTIERLFTELVL